MKKLIVRSPEGCITGIKKGAVQRQLLHPTYILIRYRTYSDVFIINAGYVSCFMIIRYRQQDKHQHNATPVQ